MMPHQGEPSLGACFGSLGMTSPYPVRQQILARIQRAKDEREVIEVPGAAGALPSTMQPLTNTPEQVRLVADWRERAKEWYPTVFAYNLENTARWIDRQVVGNSERILFLLRTSEGEPWGHLGLATFRWEPEASCELDAVMRGRSDLVPGGMTLAVERLLQWTHGELGIRVVQLRVFTDNERAIRFYERLGFHSSRTIPLVFEQGDPISTWRECKEGEEPERHFLVMELYSPHVRHCRHGAVRWGSR